MKRDIRAIGVVAMACVLTWLAGCEKPMARREVAQTETPLRQPVAAKADATAGKAIYDSRCADCHRLGRYDNDGNADNLAGRPSKITDKLMARHNGEELNPADIANLRAFVAQQRR